MQRRRPSSVQVGEGYRSNDRRGCDVRRLGRLDASDSCARPVATGCNDRLNKRDARSRIWVLGPRLSDTNLSRARRLEHGSETVLGMAPAETLLPFRRFGVGGLVLH